jgi:hypothetical protein
VDMTEATRRPIKFLPENWIFQTSVDERAGFSTLLILWGFGRSASSVRKDTIFQVFSVAHGRCPVLVPPQAVAVGS